VIANQKGKTERFVEMDVLNAYSNVRAHRKIGCLVRDHSENKEDIREIAKKALGWRSVHRILNLGCGYGWFEEALDSRFDIVVGIDLCDENRETFLRTADNISAECLFVRLELPSPIDMPSGSFDLIVSTYSLYFFSGIVSEVKRLLAPEGTFLCITHSERMLEGAEELCQLGRLRRLIERFSAENGETCLKNYFRSVDHIDYLNSLVFERRDREDLRDYVLFKKDAIASDVDSDRFEERLLQELGRKGILRLNKNDRIFIARQ
jgi:SAM-dependent methyltransferase